ncbi:hypothetical protein KAR91_49565 [Candidatus Pacearchaeota archaeon]|nr:hypothetical protein [Candidatus Pacearchaeota archaeon]
MMKEFLYVNHKRDVNKKIIEMLLDLEARVKKVEFKLEILSHPKPKGLSPPPMAPPSGPPPGPLPKVEPVNLRGTIINELKILFDKRTQYDKRSRD